MLIRIYIGSQLFDDCVILQLCSVVIEKSRMNEVPDD